MTVNLKIAQTPAVALYSGLSAAGTSMTITPYPVDLDGTKLTISDFGSLGYCTVDPKVSGYEEIISFTGITDNGDGTATLTGLSRDLLSKYPYTTSGTGKQHGSSAVVVFSNNPQIYGRLAGIDNDLTITGIWLAPTPTLSTQIANKAYVDLIGTGSATYDKNTITGIAGENLTAGNWCYFKTSDSKWWTTSSAAAATSIGVRVAICQTTALANASTTFLNGGLDATQSGLTAGTPYYLTTGGGISSTPGTFSRFAGTAISTTQILYGADNDYTTLKQDGQQIYAADTVGTDAYAITLTQPILALKDGMVFRFKAGTANTGTATLAVNATAAKTIKKNYDQTLANNDIKSGQQVCVIYDASNDCYQMLSQLGNVAGTAPTIGGNGSDGALAVSSGTTTIDLGSAALVIKQYTSISITGTGAINFSNPGANGTVVVFLSQGDVTITSSANPTIDLRSMGAPGGAGGTAGGGTGGGGTGGTAGAGFFVNTVAGGGASANSGGVGSAGTAPLKIFNMVAKGINIAAGAGGGGGGGGDGSGGGTAGGGGAGGRGAGSLYIECGGSYNFTGVINAAGTTGTTGTAASGNASSGGGGGGGGGGMIVVKYVSLTADSGTYTVTAGGSGSGGVGGSTGSGGDGGGGGSSVSIDGSAGSTNSGTTGGAGGAGAAGTTSRSVV